MILIIILVVALILYFRFKKNNYHLTYNNITYLQGEVGSGKTTMLTYLALKERNIIICQMIIIFFKTKIQN